MVVLPCIRQAKAERYAVEERRFFQGDAGFAEIGGHVEHQFVDAGHHRGAGQQRRVATAIGVGPGGQDEFAVVAPHTLADGLATMAKRAAKLITGTHTAEGPRIAIAVGIVECPADGVSAERLLEGATEATYAAKASGAPVARKAAEPQRLLQDP